MKAINGKFFRRGVHVKDMKYLAKDMPIEEPDAPDIVHVCLKQHIGKPAKTVVAVGDYVKQGQLIAEADGAVSSRIFSSVSGTITAIGAKKNERGLEDTFISIKNDGKYDFLPMEGTVDVNDGASIRERIEKAGVVGLGGAAFPTAVKLAPKTEVDALIINGAECEPYLTCDYRLMIERTEEVVKGARYLKKALGVEKILFGIEKNKPDAIALFEKYDDIQVVKLRECYPMGGEKQLIYCCTGKKVPCEKLPADVGVIVQNVATAYAVYEAIERDKPLFERVITVSGGAINQPRNLLVKNGTPYRDIIQLCGGIKEGALGMLVDGGPMMGYSIVSDEFCTMKATSGLLALDKNEVNLESPTPCISCGKCAQACPMHLMPMDIDFYTEAGDYENAKDLGGVMNCIECGACAYVCPARRAIVQNVVKAKSFLRSQKIK